VKIPKAYKGIKVEVQKKTPKCKQRAIATADIDRKGEPIIKVWSKNKRHLTPYVLKHESAHIELGHHKPPYPKTVSGYWKQEIKAERLVNKGKQIPSARLGNMLDNMVLEFSKRGQKKIKDNPMEADKFLIKTSNEYGFSKNEMERAVNYRNSHRRKKIKVD